MPATWLNKIVLICTLTHNNNLTFIYGQMRLCGNMGFSTISQQTQEDYCPPLHHVCNRITDLTSGYRHCSGPRTGYSLSWPWLRSPQRTLSQIMTYKQEKSRFLVEKFQHITGTTTATKNNTSLDTLEKVREIV